KDGITQSELTKYIQKAITLYGKKIVDVIPQRYLEQYRLISKEQAIQAIHFPKSKELLEQALRHLKYEEFLKFHISMQVGRAQVSEYSHKETRHFDQEKIEHFISQLPYTLSNDQQKAIIEILEDIQRPQVMYRLLQGDVGCGKTVVAQVAMYATVLSGYQAVIMAPTEILAKQHYESFCKQFPKLHITLLCGSLKSKERKVALEEIASGHSQMIIGTHALFQEDVLYANLGLVITDEQHRFGVEQRRRLMRKGDAVDLLLMSATPIPRTLAISLYGDLDVSTINELPSGRKRTITKVIPHNSMSYILEDIITYLQQGTQIYVITPLVEESDSLNAKHAQGIYESLSKVLALYGKVGLLHGKMNNEEKDNVMNAFVHNEIQVLVSTTVVEVGVNVGNANVMVIYDAERFGLSQLHQLRGRVGRANQQGVCYLLSNSQDPLAKKRLKLMEKTHDGFEIANEDLRLRGSGDILGKRQSGANGFILGDIVVDHKILEVARKDAIEIMKNFEDPEYRMLRIWLELSDKQRYMD
ncbi:MAG: ATP-dependent DNA helicase RecG, partial [Erysipelotrichales bacterium]|nr:ATP-dependent DNA helicase RecG [Erysipelotrichales bacterium]